MQDSRPRWSLGLELTQPLTGKCYLGLPLDIIISVPSIVHHLAMRRVRACVPSCCCVWEGCLRLAAAACLAAQSMEGRLGLRPDGGRGAG